MIFTIGHRETYEQGLREQGLNFTKLGKGLDHRGNPYAGGAAFQQFREAYCYIQRLKPGYAVYGLLSDWERDTYQTPG